MNKRYGHVLSVGSIFTLTAWIVGLYVCYVSVSATSIDGVERELIDSLQPSTVDIDPVLEGKTDDLVFNTEDTGGGVFVSEPYIEGELTFSPGHSWDAAATFQQSCFSQVDFNNFTVLFLKIDCDNMTHDMGFVQTRGGATQFVLNGRVVGELIEYEPFPWEGETELDCRFGGSTK